MRTRWIWYLPMQEFPAARASVTPAMQARLKIDQPDLKLALVP